MMRHLLATLALLAGSVYAQGTTTATVNLAIPDNDATGVSSTITVPATASRIRSLRVGVRINHGWDEDLQIWLVPPGVTWDGPYAILNNGPVIEPPAGVVQLSTKNGGSSNNYGSGSGGGTVYTNFTSSRDPLLPSATSVKSGAAPFTAQARWIPEGLDAWDRLIGTNPSGDWRLVVVDGWAFQLGTFVSWQLEWQALAGTNLIARLSAKNLPGTSLVPGALNQIAGHIEFEAVGGAQTITSVTLQAENSVAINANFSRVALHEDINGNGLLDSGEDAVFSGPVGGGSNITLTAAPAVSMSAGQVRRYLVVADVLMSPAAAGVAFRIVGGGNINSSAARFGLFPVAFGYHPLGAHAFANAPLNDRVVQNDQPFGLRSTITVPATEDLVGGLRVGIRIDHQAVQDLDVYLLPPGVAWTGPYVITGNPPSGVIALTRDEGANGDNYGTGSANGPYVFTNFSSSIDPAFPATVQITAGGQSAPFTSQAQYRPVGESVWNTLYGTNPSGDWTLVVVDDAGGGQGSAGGNLIAWQMEYRSGPRAVLSGSGVFASSPVGVPSPDSPHAFSVQNAGELPLSITAINFSGANPGDFLVDPVVAFPVTVAASATFNFGVRFTPGAVGVRSADLNVVSNSGGVAGAVTSMVLSGLGYLGAAFTAEVGFGNRPGESFKVGSTGNVFGQLELAAGTLAETVTSLTVREGGGRVLANNVSSLRLYVDTNRDGILDGGDLLISTAALNAGASFATFALNRAIGPQNFEDWLIVGDVLASPANSTLQFRVLSAADIGATSSPTGVYPLDFGPRPLDRPRVFTFTPSNPLLIPNGSTAGIVTSIVVPATTETIAALRVGLRIDHVRVQDLEVWLVPPGVTWGGPFTDNSAGPAGVIKMAQDDGGNGANLGTGSSDFVYANFAGAADPAFSPSVNFDGIAAGNAPFVGTYYRPQDQADFNARYGASPAGSWTLIITDDNGGTLGPFGEASIGQLLSWQIEYMPPATPAVTGVANWGGSNVGVPSPLSPQPYAISNVGGTNLTITGLSLTGVNASDWSFAGATSVPVTLGSGASHNIALNFTPSALGARSAALRVTYSNGLATGLTFDFALTGTGTRGLIGLATPMDYGAGAIGMPSANSPVLHTINNTGDGPLTIASIALTGANPGDWALSGLPAFPCLIPAGGNLQFTGTLTPSATGARNAIIRVTSDSNNTPGTISDVAVFGVGGSGVISVASPVDYGFANVGTVSSNSPVTHTINNVGTSPLTISAITLTGANSGDWSLIGLPALPAAIAPSGSVNFQGSLSPSALGARNAIIRITSNTGGVPGAPTDIAVSGTGTTGVLGTPLGPISYGQSNPGVLSSLSPITHVVTNTGDGPLTITAIALTGTDAADWLILSAPGLPAVVAPSASVNVQARLIPGTVGARNATLRFTSDSGAVGGTLTNVALTGTGTQGILGTPLGPVNYGQSNVGSISSLSPQTHVISNTGDGPLTITEIALTGADAADWSVLAAPAAPVVVAPSGSINVQLQLVASATGIRNATLRLTSDMGAAPGTFTNVALAGAGTAGVLASGAGFIDYGTGLIGQPSVNSPIAHTLTNTGDGPLSITGIALMGADAADWSLSGAPGVFPVVIAPSATIQFSSTLTPSNTGARNAVLRILSDTPASPTDIALVGSGAAPTSVTGVTVGPDTGGPVRVSATVNGPAFSVVDVAVTYTGGSNPGPAIVSAGGLNVVGNMIQNVPANSVLNFEWDAYATERHTTASNYALTLTPSQASINGTPGSSAAFSLDRSGGWAQHVTPGGTPTGVYSHTMIYDTANDRVVVFGGRDTGAKLNSIWVLERGQYSGWRMLSPAGPQPQGRQYANAIYDAANQRMIMFGGLTDGGPVNDTWSLDLTRGSETWTQIAQASPATPLPRRSASLVYDSSRNRALLFAGWNGAMQYNDIWVLDLTLGNESWGAAALTPAGTAPSVRFGHAAVLDATGDRMIIFGGRSGGTDLNDVHELSLAGAGTWGMLSPSGTPPLGRYFTTHGWDSTNRALIFQSGYRAASPQRDVWRLDLSAAPIWTELAADANAGLGRVVGGAAFDAARGEMLFFGGLGSGGLTSPVVSVLDVSGSPAWVSSTGAVADNPEGRWGACMAWDNTNSRVVLWGGKDNSAYFGDVWTLDRSTPQGVWSKMTTSGAQPTARIYSGFATDAVNNRLIIHGGAQANGQLASDLWTLDLNTGAWTQWSSGTGPSARDQHTVIYDSLRNRAIVYGGRAPSFGSDVWAFDFGTVSWSQIMPLAGPTPAARYGHGASYDSVNDRMIIFAGRTSGGRMYDVWTLSLSATTETWTDRSAILPPVPAPRQNFAYAADANGTRIWLHGGDVGGASAELWELNMTGANAAWIPAPITGSAPLERYFGNACLTPGGTLYAGFGFLDNRGAADIWSIDTAGALNGWTQIGGNQPDSLVSAAYAYDPVGRRLIAFGGLGGGVHQTGLWQLDLASPVAQWSPLAASGAGPGARRSASMVYDGNSVPPRMIMFGGRKGYAHGTITDELWALQLSPGTEQWVQLSPTVSQFPGARSNHGAVIDGSNRMIVFGGISNTGANIGTVFALDLTTLNWSQVVTAGTAPSARYSMVIVYDAPRNRIVIHGGATSGGVALGDSFALSLTGTPTWSSLGATGTGPGPLYYHSAVVDAANERMIVFGGYSTAAESRLFALDLASNAWTEHTGTIAKPQARWSHVAAWDAPAGRMAIGGGYLQGEVSATQENGGVAETWFWGD